MREPEDWDEREVETPTSFSFIQNQIRIFGNGLEWKNLLSIQ